MSGFTENGLERKLAELNSTQQSIQSLSLWVVHHRKHHQTIVKIWYKEFLKAQDHRKLTFIYLANDVIQNSRKKGSEYGKAFAPVIKKTLEYMARVSGEKIKTSILRILAIWAERGIYESSLMKDFEKSYKKAWAELHGGDYLDELEEEEAAAAASEITSPGKNDSKKKDEEKNKETSSTKEKKSDSSVGSGSGSGENSRESKKREHSSSLKHHRDRDHHSHGGKRHSSSREKRKLKKGEMDIEALSRRKTLEVTGTIDEWEVDGVSQLEVKLSPSAFKDPPTEDEIISLIKDLDKMPSTDATTRGKIADLSADVSDANGADEICIDSDISRSLLKKIKSAADLLNDYNSKLDKELDDRHHASMKFQDFVGAQKDLLLQAEQRLEEHQNHERIILKMIDEIRSHCASLPDFSRLPSIIGAPLPSAGDLFNLQ